MIIHTLTKNRKKSTHELHMSIKKVSGQRSDVDGLWILHYIKRKFQPQKLIWRELIEA